MKKFLLLFVVFILLTQIAYSIDLVPGKEEFKPDVNPNLDPLGVAPEQPQQQQQAQEQVPVAEKSNTQLYGIIGVLILILIVIIYYLKKKRQEV